MRSGAPRILLLALFALAPGCSKPSTDECEQLCRRFSELNYLEQGDTPERRARWAAMQTEDAFLKHLDNCVTQCKYEGGSKDMVVCVKDAKTASDARACVAEEE